MGTTAFVNQKGGVGKTTVTLGLAAALGDRGCSTLVVDLDPQSNATTGLGIFESDRRIDSAMLSEAPGAMAALVRDVQWPADSIEVLPRAVAGSPNMAAVEHQLVADVVGAQDRLATCLEGLSERFDEILIDCPPSLGLLTVNALFAADRAVVVTEPAAWSADGVQQIITNIGRISRRRNGSPELAGVVVNRVGRTRDAAYWSKELRAQYPSLVLDPDIRLRAAVAEASASSLPLQAIHRSGAIEAMADFSDLADSLFGSASHGDPAPGDSAHGDPAGGDSVTRAPGMEHRYAGI